MNKDTYEVLSAALSFHEAITLANSDGKIDIADVMYLIEPMTKLPNAIEGAANSLTELKVMTPEERAELLSKLVAEYDIPDDAIEAKVEAGVECLLAIGKFVGTLAPAPAPAPAPTEPAV